MKHLATILFFLAILTNKITAGKDYFYYPRLGARFIWSSIRHFRVGRGCTFKLAEEYFRCDVSSYLQMQGFSKRPLPWSLWWELRWHEMGIVFLHFEATFWNIRRIGATYIIESWSRIYWNIRWWRISSMALDSPSRRWLTSLREESVIKYDIYFRFITKYISFTKPHTDANLALNVSFASKYQK
jgi:hypothetical protein